MLIKRHSTIFKYLVVSFVMLLLVRSLKHAEFVFELHNQPSNQNFKDNLCTLQIAATIRQQMYV